MSAYLENFVANWRGENGIDKAGALDSQQSYKFAKDFLAEVDKYSLQPSRDGVQFSPDAKVIPYAGNFGSVEAWKVAGEISRSGNGNFY